LARSRTVRPFVLATVLTLLAGPAAAAEPVHHAVDISLFPSEHRLRATDRITLTGGGELALFLRESLEVASLTVDGEPQPVRRDGDRVTVDLGADGRHTVEIGYKGTLDVGRQGPGIGPTIRESGSVLPARSGWLPRGAAERITYEVRVRVPSPRTALVTGARQSEERAMGTYNGVYRADYPSRGPTVFAGDYRETSRSVNGTTLRTLFPRDRGELAETYLDRTAEYIGHYSQSIGAYPYPAFTVVAAPFPVGLGFEGVTYVSERILDLPYMKGRSLAHEVLHSWWGNAVGIAYEEGNWAEGLTTYQADHRLAAQRSPESAREMRRDWLRDFAVLPASRRKPLTAFTSKLHDAAQVTGYNKAAMVFHMLRQRLGTETFRDGLSRFYEARKFQTGSWSDLRQAFEAAHGESLAGVFEQWLTRPGAPALRLDRARRMKTGENRWQVEIALGQGAPVYDLRVPVTIETALGPERLSMTLDGDTATREIDLRAEPKRVLVDPDYDLFRALPAGQVPLVMRGLTLNPDTRLVAVGIDAATARRFAGRLLDTRVSAVSPADAAATSAPLLVVGGQSAVADTMRQAGFGPPPEEVAGKGDLRAWTAEANGRIALAVAADKPAELPRTARVLPYYLRASWLVMQGGQLQARGTWPTGPNPLRHAFGE
jgi:aminopeptidase N